MHYHFIGIKGSGMASLAEIVADRGDEVSGSDIEKYIFTQKPLEERGIPTLSFHAQTTFMKVTRSSSASPSMRATRRYTRPMPYAGPVKTLLV